MKSIKPGRGPSSQAAVGSVVSIIFGVIWTIGAFSMTRDAPFPMVGIIFPLFGIVFIAIGVFNAVYHYKNATGKDRMSLFDIVDQEEESDPLQERYGRGKMTPDRRLSKMNDDRNGQQPEPRAANRRFEGDYCPYCGTKMESDFDYCPKCGKDI
ncbi:zinc-ribbon domain-containing protein [Paenibacillus marinisediminis]